MMKTPQKMEDLRKTPHWSYSALSCYLQCPMKYYFRYEANAPVEHTGSCIPFGKAFHSALTARAIHGRNFRLSEAREAFAEHFRLESKAVPELRYKAGETFDSCIAKGFDMLQVALDCWQDDFVVKGAAVPFTATIPGVSKPLIGEYDLVVTDGGSDAVVDWKTASSKWASTRADLDLQATAYTYAYNQQSGENPVFRFDVYTKAKTPTLTSHYTMRTAEDWKKFEFLAVQVDRCVEQKCFYPNISCMNCTECPYQKQCMKEAR